MAIDTRDKRASAIGVANIFRMLLPNPDPEAETQGDRQQMSFVYRGIAIFFAANGAILAVIRTRSSITNATIQSGIRLNIGSGVGVNL
jgi:hypothetical protein